MKNGEKGRGRHMKASARENGDGKEMKMREWQGREGREGQSWVGGDGQRSTMVLE